MPNFLKALSLLDSSACPGPDFYRDAVLALSLGLGCRWAAVVRRSEDGACGEVLAACDGGALLDPLVYPLAGTPCEALYRNGGNGTYSCPQGLAEAFPGDPRLSAVSGGSYRGQVIRAASGEAVGHVYVMDDGPMADDLAVDDPAAEVFFRLLCLNIASQQARWDAERALGQSRASFEALAEHAPAVVCLIDRQNRYLYVNKRFCDLYGIQADDILGKATEDFFDDAFTRPILAQDRKVLASGRAVEREHLVHSRTGDRRFLDVKFPVFSATAGEGGEIVALGLIGSDVTEHQNTAAALLRAEEDYREIFKRAPLGIYRSDLQGRFIQANPALAEMLGCGDPAELIAEIDDVSTQFYVDPTLHGQLRNRVAEAGTLRGVEAEVLRKDGSKIWINESFRSVREPTGGLLYFEGFVEDITSRKAAKAALSGSELLKRSVLECALDCIVTIDQQGRFVEFNPAAERTFGYRREAVIGQPMVDTIVPPSLRGAHRAGFKRHLCTGEATVLGKRIELTALRADGEEFPIEIAITRGTIRGETIFTAYIRDIQKRKQVEAALEAARQETIAAEALLSDAIEHMSEGIVVYDAEDKLMLCNGTFRALYGYAPGDVSVGTSFEELGWIDIKKGSVALAPGEERDYFRRRVDYRRRLEGELEVQLKDGRWLQVRDRRTAAGGVVSLQADVTERKTAEIELRAAKEQAEAATEAKSRFLANMSHELRTPLNAILGYTELISDGIYGEVPARVGGVIARVEQNGRHLLAQVNNVPDLSKIEAGQLALSLLDYSWEDILDTVMVTAEGLAADKGLALRMEVEGNLPTVFGDAQRIVQILLNLVGNAVKFSDAGQVVITAAKTGETFVISVSDDGPGVPPEKQKTIFEEFQQVDASQSANGTGLGLAIAKSMAELHGGDLGLDPTLGEGSTFTLRLPLRVQGEAVTA